MYHIYEIAKGQALTSKPIFWYEYKGSMSAAKRQATRGRTAADSTLVIRDPKTKTIVSKKVGGQEWE